MGAISELLSALIVLVSLIYVARQIRQNTATVATATYESVLSGYTSINLVIAGDATLARIACDGLYSPEKLSETEAIQFFREAAQVLITPGGASFRAQNQLFADLYAEIDRLTPQTISQFTLGQTPRT